MTDYELTEHALDMLKERNIKKDWIRLAMDEPEKKEPKNDGTIHFIRPINEHGGRYLRVVVNPNLKPQKIVTAFFDRRIRRLS